jgi:hypothetical protein
MLWDMGRDMLGKDLGMGYSFTHLVMGTHSLELQIMVMIKSRIRGKERGWGRGWDMGWDIGWDMG